MLPNGSNWEKRTGRSGRALGLSALALTALCAAALAVPAHALAASGSATPAANRHHNGGNPPTPSP
ncbi:MAG TPA: hypothetical protein VN835_00615, partial [Steroidobacteraceae bacterium]|nr:hypothetical protein [Steroidobacteraceae bacterium]